MTSCSLSLDACVLRQRTNFQSFQASSQLSFASWERHSPWPSVTPWTQIIFYTVNQLFYRMCPERNKSRRPFVPTARKLLNILSILGIRAAQWTNCRWSAEYSKLTSVLHVFIPRASSRPLGMGLSRTFLVKLNRLRTGVERFYSSMYKMGSRTLAEMRVWRHQSNRRPRYLNVPLTSGTSSGGWSDGFE